jgi:hypothetical protein
MKKFILLTIMSVAAGTALMAQDLTVCYGKGYTLNSTAAAVSADGSLTYTWYENDVLLDGENEATLTIAGGRAVGTYAYWRMASNAECPGGVASNTFTVRVLPVSIDDPPTMGGNGNVYCGSGTITAAPGSGGTGIRWTDGSSTVSPRTVAASGTYYAVTTEANGCESSAASVVVTIYTVPGVPIMTGGGTQCGGTTKAITATAGTNGNGIRWTDDPSAGTYRSVGTGTYEAVTTSADGCMSAATWVTVTIRPARGNGVRADDVCGCASNLTNCSGTCRTPTTTTTTGDCSTNCRMRTATTTNECGTVVSTTPIYDAACVASSCVPQFTSTCQSNIVRPSGGTSTAMCQTECLKYVMVIGAKPLYYYYYWGSASGCLCYWCN